MITFANVEIPRSPFEVNIGKHKTSKIKAYGPGLKGGIVNKPAKFTVDTCGETGALGFSIQGPSQAKINCKVGPHTFVETQANYPGPISYSWYYQ